MRCSLVSTPPIFAALLVCQACGSAGTAPEAQVEALARTLAEVDLPTEADVQGVVSHAASCDRAILFVHLDWAIMGPQRMRCAEFMLDWHRVHPNDVVQFHYVDCTPIASGYGPLSSLPGWAELEAAAGTALVHGWGELVWLEQGRVLHVERILSFESSAKLIEKTGALFASTSLHVF